MDRRNRERAFRLTKRRQDRRRYKRPRLWHLPYLDAGKNGAGFLSSQQQTISVLFLELLRKGRFDEIFFVDLPSAKERENIFQIHLKNKHRNAEALGLNMAELVKKTEGFSGAEIEEVVNEALFNAYANGQKDLEMQNLLDCISATSPLSSTMAETIANLRKWAEQRARMASKDKPDEVKPLGEEVPRLQQEYSNPFIQKKK